MVVRQLPFSCTYAYFSGTLVAFMGIFVNDLVVRVFICAYICMYVCMYIYAGEIHV